MKRTLLWTLTALPLFLAAADGDFALTVQGIFSGKDGVSLIDRNRTLVVRLYESETSTNCLWARAYAVTLATNGLFTTTLTDREGSRPDDGRAGSCATLLEAVLAASNHVAWAGFEDTRTAGELKPRVRLSRVPRALRAFRACRPDREFTIGGKLRASILASGNATVGGDLRSPSFHVLETLAAGRTLNVGSLSVDRPLSVGTSLQSDFAVSVTGTLAIAKGCLKAKKAEAKTLSVGTGALAKDAKITIGGAPADFPVGAITMWSGTQASIPNGWHICNGNDGTPDLRERFIVGVGPKRSLGKPGGADSVTLKLDHIPAHSHSISARNLGYVAHRNGKSEVVASSLDNRHDTSTEYVGADAPHENRPPYYALYFIQRIK